MKKKLVFFILLLMGSLAGKAQEKEEEDPSKLIREVIEIQVEKTKAAAPAAPVEEPQTGKKKGKKKQVEETPVEQAAAEEGGTMPAPVAELTKRADHWTKSKNKQYKKDNVAGSGSTISCTAIFIYKPKVLNPTCDVEGEISMEMIIECKEGKYRYTIKNIKHKSRNQNVNGGDIYNDVAECGSMALNDLAWKQIKSAAFVNASFLAQDLKTKMSAPVEHKKDEW